VEIISFAIKSDQLEARALPSLLNLISSKLELISHQSAQQGIGIQEIRNQYQRNEEDWYVFVLRDNTNFHAAWNNGLTFKIGPGEVCATSIKLPPWVHGVV
jgi:hypothetical protein